MGHGHQGDLWKGLRMNELAIVSTDHCPFCMKDQKELGIGNFAAIPNGIGGVEHRMELIYQGVVAGELSLERWVETCSTTPARMFGMYPKKGVIAPGSDADVVVWDPNTKTKIGINDKHHMNMDHSAWEGWVIDGKVDTVFSRGNSGYFERIIVGRKGQGQFHPSGAIPVPRLARSAAVGVRSSTRSPNRGPIVSSSNPDADLTTRPLTSTSKAMSFS
jgi:dihydropyrimidinase